MNSGQRWIRLLGLVLLVVMVLFPPWKISFTAADGSTPESASMGYHPLWFRLEVGENETRTNVQQRIDIVRLGLQLGAVLILTNLALLGLRKKA